MTKRQMTQLIIMLTIGVLIVWDIIVASNVQHGDTESEIVRDYSIWPILPASLGVLMGHFFWHSKNLVSGRTTLMILGQVAAVLIILQILAVNEIGGKLISVPFGYLSAFPGALFPIFFVVGHYAWPQRPPEDR